MASQSPNEQDQPEANGDSGPSDVQLRWEEEAVSYFERRRYYPVHIGMRIADRYKVLAKLGYGATSTVWYCLDESDQSYKAVKVCIHEDDEASAERQAYQRIASKNLDLETENALSLRQCLDMFVIDGVDGRKHHCFVHQPAACSISRVWYGIEGGVFELDHIKWIARRTLRALHFLHCEAKIIHTDVKPDNVLMPIMDAKALELIAKSLEKYSHEVKYVGTDQYPVYKSVTFEDTDQDSWGDPVLADLGEAALIRNDPEYYGEWLEPVFIGAASLRPPESVLGTVWNCTVDVWMTGCMILWMLENKLPFKRDSPEENYDEDVLARYLAQIQAVIGPPPANFLEVLIDSQPF